METYGGIIFATWAEDAPSLEAAPLENGEVQAKTAFLVYRSHRETGHQLLSGWREECCVR